MLYFAPLVGAHIFYGEYSRVAGGMEFEYALVKLLEDILGDLARQMHRSMAAHPGDTT